MHAIGSRVQCSRVHYLLWFFAQTMVVWKYQRGNKSTECSSQRTSWHSSMPHRTYISYCRSPHSSNLGFGTLAAVFRTQKHSFVTMFGALPTRKVVCREEEPAGKKNKAEDSFNGPAAHPSQSDRLQSQWLQEYSSLQNAKGTRAPKGAPPSPGRGPVELPMNRQFPLIIRQASKPAAAAPGDERGV